MRRQQFVFKVRVPKDWGKKDLIWTLRVNGKMEKAYASLLPFQELGLFVYQENRGSAADITDTPEPNEPPTIKMAGATQLTASGRRNACRSWPRFPTMAIRCLVVARRTELRPCVAIQMAL